MQESIAEEFEQAVVDNVRKLKMGGGMDPKTTLGPLIAPNAIERVSSVAQLRSAVQLPLMLFRGQASATLKSACTMVI